MPDWSLSLQRTRYVMDLLLLVFFILANVPQVNLPFHEWISFVFIVPFIVHLLLHYDWLLRIPARFFQRIGGENRFNFIFDCMLYLLMIFVIISGILASEVVLPLFMHFEALPFWTEVHHKYSNLLIILVGVHLGMHWRWIVNLTMTMLGKSRKGAAKVADREPT